MKNAVAKLSDTSMGKLNSKNLAMPYRFSIRKVLLEAFKKVYGSKAVYWRAIAWILIINIGLSIVSSILAIGLGSIAKSGLFVVAWFVNVPLWIGLSYLAMRRSVGLLIDAKMIFKMYQFYWRIIAVRAIVLLFMYLAAFCLGISLFFQSFGSMSNTPIWMAVLSIIACLVLVFISYYIIFGFSFAVLLVVEKNFNVWSALKGSILAFNQHWFKIILTYLITSLIIILSVIPLCIPLIWTLPMIMNVHGILYRTIFGVEEARDS